MNPTGAARSLPHRMVGVFTDIMPHPRVADVLLGQGADPACLAERAARAVTSGPGTGPRRYQRIVAVTEQAIDRGLTLIRPQAAWAIVPDWRQQAPLLVERLGATPDLARTTALIAVALTIGDALENEVERLLPVDVALAGALDSFGSCASQQLGTAVYRRWQAWAASTSLACSPPVSPGRAEWPVDIAQPELLTLVPAARVPITVNAFGHLHPRKSVSFVIGLHPSPVRPGQEDDLCTPCLVQPTCRWRRAGLRCRQP